jgi:hypothetical protein
MVTSAGTRRYLHLPGVIGVQNDAATRFRLVDYGIISIINGVR